MTTMLLASGVVMSALVGAAPATAPTVDKTSPNCLASGCHGALVKQKFVHRPAKKRECDACHEVADKKQHKFKMAEEGNELCTSCHDAPTTKKHVHDPVKTECTACHNPHSSPAKGLLVKKEMRALCLTCHKLPQKKFVHGPVAAGACMACHEPHESDHPKLMRQSGSKQCFECHSDLEARMKQAKHVHSPVKKDCRGCHSGHSSDHRALLNRAGNAMCLACHKDVNKELSSARVVHGVMKAEGGCLNCHEPHATPWPRMLKQQPASLCLGCHEKSMVLEKKTDKLTRFRNGDQNLHYVHVNRRVKGRTCRACHQAHASSLPAHVRESVPFGKRGWRLPLQVSLTKTGGRCTGCHRPMGYDRVKPVDNAFKAK